MAVDALAVCGPGGRWGGVGDAWRRAGGEGIPSFIFFIFFYIFYPRGTLRGTKNPVTGYSTIFEFT